MIDTHSHLFAEEFTEDLPAVIERAKAAGVSKVLMPNIDDTTIEAMLSVCTAYQGYCFPMIGFHPTSVDADSLFRIHEMKKIFSDGHPFIAIGEVGMDLYWDKTYLKEQQKALDIQVQWALEYHLPLVLHCREAFPELFEVMEPYKTTELSGVFHSFTGTLEEAEKVLEYSRFVFGINGVVTFKKARTAACPDAECLYLAVGASVPPLAVAGVALRKGHIPDDFDRNLMAALLNECALALEKERIAREKSDAELQAQQEQLRANLLRTISHDLRTPLTSISGNAGVLMENSSVLDEAKKQRLYADIYDDSMWLVQLVENLLSITRLENGGLDLRIQPELLEEVAGEALQHLNRRSAEYPIRVDIEDDLLMAKMDSRLITQVIINIVNNAVKYTPPGTDITLSARREGDTVRVEIADTGPGIPQEAQGRLFQMFYTAGNDRGDGRRGLGLGLALCKSIVEAHGGKIGMRANEPHGSVFFFTLQAEEIKL